MNEESRIIIEEYCRAHRQAKKGDFLGDMVKMAYKKKGEPEEWRAVRLEQYISKEEDPEMKKALEELNAFLFG